MSLILILINYDLLDRNGIAPYYTYEILKRERERVGSLLLLGKIELRQSTYGTFWWDAHKTMLSLKFCEKFEVCATRSKIMKLNQIQEHN